MRFLPSAAQAYAGGSFDPLDIWQEKFESLLADLVDVENWKNGEKSDVRRDRKMAEYTDMPGILRIEK